MKSFLVGLGIGIGLGVLFAPVSGDETRSNIRDRANDLADTARETVERGRERVRSGISAIRGSAEAATGTESSRPTAALGPLTDIFLTEDHHGQRRRCPFLVSAASLTPPDPAFILEFRPCSRERVWARHDVARASRISCRGTARCSSVSAN